jgi:mono/diheme cytochrome c family protein
MSLRPSLALVAALVLTLPAGAASAQTSSAESQMLFSRIAAVLKSPRCLNCHTDAAHPFPRQGDDRHRHLFNVERGASDIGALGLHCSTCHQAANNAASGVPGAAGWRLAPLSMAWEGLSDGQICRALLDPTRNGQRNAAALVDHFAHESLVSWAWAPGTDHNGRPRTTPPLAHDEFNRTVERWLATGAACPQ